MFEREVATLPVDVFINGIVLEANEIIGVRMYDEGDALYYVPALFLLQCSNQSERQYTQLFLEAIALAVSFGRSAAFAPEGIGAGGLIQGATLAQRILIWGDRIAATTYVITRILQEHRGWIISRFGESGRRFVDYVDLVNAAVTIYGGARVVLEMGRLIYNLGAAYRNWRRAVGESRRELTPSQQNIIDEVSEKTDEFFENATLIENARRGTSRVRRIIPTGDIDSAAQNLARRLNGQPSVRLEGFGNREFDAISNEYIAQTFGGETFIRNPHNFLSQSRRIQIRETIRAASETERSAFFEFRGGSPAQEIVDFINRNANRAGVRVVVDVVR